MADSFVNGSAVAGIEIRVRKGRTDEVPPAPRAEGVDRWLEVLFVHEGGFKSPPLPPIFLHMHRGSAWRLIGRLQKTLIQMEPASPLIVTFIKNGMSFEHSNTFHSMEEAVVCGNALVSEKRADFYRIDEATLSSQAFLAVLTKKYDLRQFSCECGFDGLVYPGTGYTSCPQCRSL